VTSLDRIIDTAEIVVSCGSGGVGKTTTAAAMAVYAASIGKRVVVVTIDPARRLADAFGLADGLTNDPTLVDISIPDGSGHGELWAMMLDPATTFDGLVREHASSPERAERILANAFYRNIAGALSGTQEYMAAEKLYQLHRDERFDLVVVDTPPTRNALDFLDAPATLTRFISHRLFRLMMLPARGGMRVLNIAAQPLLRTVGKVVGGDVLADAIAFFQAFEGMEAGFRDRADEVSSLLHSPKTSYVLVASARADTVVEAMYFAGRLVESHLTVGAVVINRLQPRFGDATPAEAATAADAAAAAGEPELAGMWRNLGELHALADAEEGVIAPLVADVPATAIHRVPLLADDVHDLDGLRAIAAHLFMHH
jgi:anion-transporting  ArsA/GET3 family ATPase